MTRYLFIIILLYVPPALWGQTKTIHVFVALCDNENQGIVPVPGQLGNGKNPDSNLYWGAMYGVKSWFKNKASGWKLVRKLPGDNKAVLERLLFRHSTKAVYMLAEAYDGEQIRSCVEDFLKAANGQNPAVVTSDSLSLNFGGEADLLAYVGHDGLMDFNVNVKYNQPVGKAREVMVLACYSKNYFYNEVKKSGATPLLWTTHLMAPEAYTLGAAITGWI